MDERLISAVNFLIQRFPNYGIYIIDPRLTVTDDNGKVIIYPKDTSEVVQYLVDEGFSVIRYDAFEIINDKEKLPRELTDRGRKLKELGSIEAFTKYHMDEEQLKYLLNHTVLRSYYVNLCIALGTSMAAVYYYLLINETHPCIAKYILGIGLSTVLIVVALKNLPKRKKS